MKYIVTKREEDELEEIFLFPRTVNHDCMAEVLQSIRNQKHGAWKIIHREPISAGFVEGGKCFGKSESLDLQSRPELDTALLNLSYSQN